METAFTRWTTEKFRKLLQIDQDELSNIVEYIASLEDVEEVSSFVEDILFGCSDSQFKMLKTTKKRFINDLKDQFVRFGNSLPLQSNSFTQVKSENSIQAPNLGVKKKVQSIQKKPKKKQSYVSLYGKDGELHTKAVLLPGRHICECQAQKHKLINNCLGCGRVVCAQEGSGPCLFCGKLVCTKEEKEILSRNSRKSEKLEQKLMNIPNNFSLKDSSDHKPTQALQKALKYKQRLLEYDRMHKSHTKVIDDESDYYNVDSNVWLSEKEKQLLTKKQKDIYESKYGSRRNKKFTLDFAGRQIIETKEEHMEATLDAEVMEANFGSMKIDDSALQDLPNLVRPRYDDMTVQYVQTEPSQISTEKCKKVKSSSKMSNRLQDDDLMLLSDHGMCMSMHQPWATLLVAGIKIHEGRSWYSSHRGRLWIASTAKIVQKNEIQMVVDDHIRHISSTGGAIPSNLPTSYPTGCLLGYVDIEEVISQEEYSEKYADGMSESPYVFVCKNPQELKLKMPVKGQHKIWKLDPNMHKAARKAMIA